MVDVFHKHIQDSLANENLQSALDANAEKRINARLGAIQSLPEDWNVMRKRAHEVRLHTINNLDVYLEQFINQVEENGVIVHHAADASQAVQIVLDLARERDCNLIAKSKTMVSEEIGLNHILEENGIEAVETDLGEYIIQLRGEPPAHIITPAVHLRKEDCAVTFQEKLGIPYTEDIATMTAAARNELRQTFLKAEIGLSGVNFGVAETGTLCIVTNEGNGRMVTTLPKVHIALMGIERLVPTMDDLGLMLELLPRSATGQKITVYTQLMNKPRQPGEVDGPHERHLILVDNGRSAMRESPLAEALLCIRCGACLNACPVFAEIGGHAYVNDNGKSSTYPGPIGSIVSPGLFGQSEFGQLARASSLCGACKEACPVDIDLPKLLLRVRAGGINMIPEVASKKIPVQVYWGMRFYTWIAKDPRRYKAVQKVGGFFSRIIALRSGWLKLPAFTGWGYSKDLPRPAQETFHDIWKARLGTPTAIEQAKYEGEGKPARSIEGETIPQPDLDSLIQKFTKELVALEGTFTACSETELPQLVYEALQSQGINSLLAWDDDQLPEGLAESLRVKGVNITQELDADVKAGLSGASGGIAASGTLILPSGPGKPQFVSLLPEVHFVILRASDIYSDLAQVMKNREILDASVISLISGPSRTADIEMTLTIGVHGPSQVNVFCLEGK